MSNPVATKRLSHFSMARVKRLVSLGDVVATLLAIWTIFWPTPYYVLIACCFILPLLAICLDVWIGGALTWDTIAYRRNPLSFAPILLMPALALGCRALGDFNFLNWQTHVAWSLLVAAIIGGSACWLVPQARSSSRQLSNICLFALAFGYAAVTFADTLLDPFATRTMSATVHDKYVHVSGGVHGFSFWYNVSVAPSPPGWTWILVRPDIYDELHIGERVCVNHGSGLLGIGWLEVRPCENAWPRWTSWRTS